MTNCEIKTCPKCWRPVSCQYDGDSYVGQCHWCGKMIAYQYCPKPESTFFQIFPQVFQQSKKLLIRLSKISCSFAADK